MNAPARFGFWLAIAASLSACLGEESGEPPRDEELIGTDFAQCEGRPGGGVDRSPEVMRTIEMQVPNEDINCTDKMAFSVAGRQVSLVYVAFGIVSDCPAGCFSQDLCAVYDAPDSLLYSTTRRPEPDRPGLAHPLTQTSAFQSFPTSQKNSGSWRFCFHND